MSIHKEKNGSYRVRWREDYKMKSKHFKRKTDAVRFEAEVKSGLKKEEISKPTKRVVSVSFGKLANNWLLTYAHVHKSPLSVIKDRQMLTDYLLPTIGDVTIENLNLKQFFELQTVLLERNRLSPKTVNLVMGLAHKILADSTKWRLIGSNPMRGLKPLKIPPQDFCFWSISERDQFLSYCKKVNYRVYEVVAFTILTGLRRGEVHGLKWDCVDFDRRSITVKRSFCHRLRTLNEYTKGKNIRWVPMNAEVTLVLEGRRQKTDSEFVFDLEFTKFTVRHFKPLQIKAGVTPITFHDLRHSFASHLVMTGVNPFHIKQLLGHVDIKTTMRYVHLSPDFLQGITDKLSRKE